MLEESAVVVAHPDDEVLWFSSVLKRADKVIVCFLEHASDSKIAVARKKSLSEHAIKGVRCLNLKGSKAYNRADWRSPEIDNYGIKFEGQERDHQCYENNYHKLIVNLERELKGIKNVLTHNPWGEYGHEEHIQVYRAVKELQGKLCFNIWFDVYCSNKSMELMLQYFSDLNVEHISEKINASFAERIMEIYKKNGCWTWFDDWEWPDVEYFTKDLVSGKGESMSKRNGLAVPVNLIKVKMPVENGRLKKFRSLMSLMKRSRVK